MSLDDAASLAVASIYISSETKEGIEHIKMSKISGEEGVFEFIKNEDMIQSLLTNAKSKYPSDGEIDNFPQSNTIYNETINCNT